MNQNKRWLRFLRSEQRRLRYVLASFALGFAFLAATFLFGLYSLGRKVSLALDQQAEAITSLTTTVSNLDLAGRGDALNSLGEKPVNEVDKKLVEAIWDMYGVELLEVLGVDIGNLSPLHHGAVILRRLGGEFADSFVGELGSQAARKILGIKESERLVSGDVLLSVSLSGGSEAIPAWVVYFDLNEAVIPVSGEAAILGAASQAQALSRTLVVFGSTDTTGEETHNEELAQERIDAVREFLATHKLGTIPVLGVPLHGRSRPIGTLDEVSEPKNRCAYILVL